MAPLNLSSNSTAGLTKQQKKVACAHGTLPSSACKSSFQATQTRSACRNGSSLTCERCFSHQLPLVAQARDPQGLGQRALYPLHWPLQTSSSVMLRSADIDSHGVQRLLSQIPSQQIELMRRAARLSAPRLAWPLAVEARSSREMKIWAPETWPHA